MADALIRIFISYSRVDTDFVDRLQADLQARNFDVWVDRRKLEGGRDWAEMIETAIDRCQVMIVVFSPDALDSDWVKKEYSYAQYRGKHIIPVHFRPTPKVPMRLNELQYVDFERNYDAGVRELLIALTPVTALPPPPIVPTPPPIESAGSETSLDDLVVVRPAPPRPNQNLEALYRAGVEANVDGDLERASVLWGQILEQDPNFQNGTMKTQFDRLNQNLQPIRTQRLRDRAMKAAEEKDWRQAAGAWRAILEITPQDPQAQQELRRSLRQRALRARRDGQWGEEIGAWEAYLKLEPNNEEIRELLTIAEHNQQWEFKYASAQQFAKDGKLGAAKAELELLWSNAPYYGDPADIASTVGATVPLFEEVRTAHQREVELQKTRVITALRGRAETQHKLGDWVGEIATLNELLKIQSGNNQILSRISAAQAAQKQANDNRQRAEQRQNSNLLRTQQRQNIIRDRLKTTPFWVGLNTFLALTALGGAVGILTQQWYAAIIVVEIASLILYLIILNRVHTIPIMVGIMLLASAGASGLTWLSTLLQFSDRFGSHLWLFGDRAIWVGRQIDFGLIIGTIAGLIGGLIALSSIAEELSWEYKNYSLSGPTWSLGGVLWIIFIVACGATGWAVVAIASTIFSWGFGFGYGWNLSLFLAMIPPIVACNCISGIFLILFARTDEQIAAQGR